MTDKHALNLNIQEGTVISRYTITGTPGDVYPDDVYFASDNNLDRRVIIQFLPSKYIDDNAARGRFNKAARALAAISHPNLAHIYEVSEYEGRPYVAMEFIGLRTLFDVIRERGLSSSHALDFAIGICAGLKPLHEAGIAHLSLRPDQIAIRKSNRIQISPVAHLIEATMQGAEPEDEGDETDGYKYTEEEAVTTPDFSGNIYSVGIILYEMFAGKHPSKGRKTSKGYSPPVAPEFLENRRKVQIASELRLIMEKALGKNRETRYLRIEYLQDDLENARIVNSLCDSEEQYRNVVEQANDGICIIQNKLLKIINRRLAGMIGYTVEFGLNTPFSDYLHPDEISRVVEKYNLQITGRERSQRYETVLVHKEGRPVEVEINAVLISYEGHRAILAIVRDISRRKRDEKALRESEKKFSSLFHQSNDAIFIHDMDGNIIEVNQRTVDMFGFHREQLLSMKIPELHPKSALFASRQAFKLLQKERQINFEIEFIRSSGEAFPAEVSAGILDIGDKQIVQGIVRDISKRRKAELAFRENRRMLSTLMNNLPGMAYRCKNDPNWTMEFISDGCKELTGYEVFEILNNSRVSYNDIIHPDDRENVWDGVQHALENRKHFRLIYRITAKDKSEKWVWEQGCGIFSSEGDLIALEGFITDFTRVKDTEEHMKRLSSIVMQSNEGMALVDLEGNIEFVNQAFAEMHGYSSDELRGKNLTIFHTEAQLHEVEAANRQIQKTGKFSGEIWHKHRNGSVFLSQMDNSLLYDDAGRPIGMIGIMRDITEQKKAEMRLRESEEKYRNLVDLSPDPVIIVQDEYYVLVNQAFTEIFGYTQEDVDQGLNMMQLVQDKDSERIRQYYESRKVGEISHKVVAIDLVAKNGTTISCESSAAIIQYNGRPAELVIIRDITERKKAENAIREAHEQLNATLNALPDLLFEVDSSGHIVDFRAPDPEKLYRPPEEFLGKKMVDVIPPDAAKVIAEEIKKTIKNGQSRGATYPLKLKGVQNWFEISSVARGDMNTPDGRITFLIRDITDRKKAAEALKNSEEKYRRVFEDSVLGLYRTSPEGKILMINPALLKMLGYSSLEELSQKNLIDSGYAPGYDRKAFADEIESKGMITGWESAWTKKDGTTLYIRENARAIRDKDGKTLYYEGTVEDITVRREAEIALSESEEKYRLLIENSGTIINLFDRDGKILMINTIGAEFLGGKPSDFIGKSLHDIMPDKSDFLLERNRQVIETGKGMEFEDLMDLPVGRKWFLSNLQLIKNAAGEIIGVQIISQDITERKLSEQELSKSNEVIRQERNMFVNGPVIVFKWQNRPGWPIEYASPNIEEVLGYSAQDLTSGKLSYIDLIFPEDMEKVVNEVEAYKESGVENYSHQPYRMITKDGHTIWVSDYTTILKNDNGIITHHLGYIVDITERKLAEDMLRKRTEQLNVERKELKNKNIALNQILDHMDSQKQNYQQQVYKDVEQALRPFMKKLREKAGPEHVKEFEALEGIFDAILAKDLDDFASRYAKLTSRESEICGLIQNGMSSKQIAELLNLSSLTVLKHREQIRKKLGITNKSINLATYLRSH